MRGAAISQAVAVALAAFCVWPAGQAAAQAVFTDVTVSAGVDYLQHAPQSAPSCVLVSCEPERMSGGAAAGDVDGDGDLDLVVTRLDAADILFRNLGDGTFEDATAGSGLDLFDVQSNGVALGDIDNDGDLDLYVSVIGATGDAANNRNYLFVNDGTGAFSEQALARGAAVATPGVHKSTSVALGDYDRDGWIDIHVTEWFPENGSNARLLHNRGSGAPGYFEDRTNSAGVSLDFSHAFASSFTDLDADGWPDLLVAADFGTSYLFWNDGDGTFTDGTLAAGVGTDENGMGSTVGDFDLDGDLDWFVTAIHDPAETCEAAACFWGYTGNRLYRNDGGRSFSDATDAAGVREGFWGWGTAFFDYDNDGDLDLVMTNGFDITGPTLDDAFNANPMRLWRNDGSGVMTEVSSAVGVTDTGSGKGLLVFDYDGDGDLDLFVVNNAAGPRLYRNDGGNANGFLRVKLVGILSNRDALGARVTLRAAPGAPVQLREVGSVSHFLGQSESLAHFGLGGGSGTVATLEVEWPSGERQVFRDVPRNQTLTLLEPVAVPALPGGAVALLFGSLLAAGASGVSVRAGARSREALRSRGR